MLTYARAVTLTWNVSTELIRIACSDELGAGAAGELPNAFRIFRLGVNETSKGPFLWDAEAAAATLAKFEQEGVDLQIDLEHDSLSEDARAHRHDAGDARGYCKLAVRDGELWAVSVRWSADGARRLTERTQKYISPVALRHKKTNRVMGIHNLALCANPATYGAAPLVAASKRQVANSGSACKTLIALLTEQYRKTQTR